MKKIFKKTFLLSFFIFFFSCFFFATDVFAEICKTSADCFDYPYLVCTVVNPETGYGICGTGGGDWGNPALMEYKEDLVDCAKNNTMNVNSLFGGCKKGGVLSAILDTLMAGLDGLPSTPNSPTARMGISTMIASSIPSFSTNMPASTKEYIADLGREMGIVKNTYAADSEIGVNKLKSLLLIWKTFRDIAYAFMVVIFIAIGLAIMFRLKLDAKTAVTIQNSIPKMIVTLILITFSYAIAGLVIDLANVIGALIITAIDPQYLHSAVQHLYDFLHKVPKILGGPINIGSSPTNQNLFDFTGLFMIEGYKYAQTMNQIFNPITLLLTVVGVDQKVIDTMQKISEFTPLGAAELPVKILSLIFSIILLGVFIKLIITLIKCYVSIIISVIFAPLQIMIGALPGQNGFKDWFKNLVSNVAVFPAVMVMMALTSKIYDATRAGSLWIPSPLSPPGLKVSTSMIGGIVGYGMLLLIGKVPDMVKEALAVKAFKYESAIGEPLKAATPKAIIGYGKQASGAAKQVPGLIDRAQRVVRVAQGGGLEDAVPEASSQEAR